MSTRHVIWVILAMAVVAGMSSPATAQGWPYPYHYGVYGPWAYTAQHVGQHTGVPYYALYPPVYYSHAVKRPYGLSPFADLPVGHGYGAAHSTCGPARVAARPKPAEPLLLKNPHVADHSAVAPQQQQASRAPLRIVNPYVVVDVSDALAAAEQRQPQRIFPTASAQRRH